MSRVLLENVTLRFGATQVVSDVNLEVGQGEFVTLLGPSGCGKTSTLRMIAGLQQNSEGRITVGDRVVSDPAARVFVPPDRRRLGMVFQSYAIWPHMTVFDNVAYPLKVRREPAARIAQKVAEVLKLVAMEDYGRRPAPALSGGQQQRVAIARALVGEPSVLLMDEPLSNLDAKLRVQMGEEFRSLQRRLGITTIYVTHDQEEAMTLSDRIVLMSGGRIRQSGPPAQLYRRPVDVGVASFFGSPNLLPVVVASSASSSSQRIRVSVGSRVIECPGGMGVREGEALLMVARPEDIQLHPAGTVGGDGHLVLPATVRDAVFRGGRATVLLDAGDRRLRAEVPALRIPEIGTRLDAVIPAEALWCVSDR